MCYRLAEEKKESGNHLYKFKNYKGALAMYEEAIKLCPDNASYYGNRSACYMMMGMYKKALEDAQKAVALDPTFTKGYIRVTKCCIALGMYILNGALIFIHVCIKIMTVCVDVCLFVTIYISERS